MTTDHPRRGLRGLAAAALLVAAMALPAPAVMAMDAAPAEVEPVPMDLEMTAAAVTELRTVIDDLSTRNDVLQADNTSLQQTVDTLALERDRLADSLHHFDDLYEPLEADRQLLFELRKGLPETRIEAEAQLDRIRSLALSSNPARLGQLVARVDDAAPAFLDWRFTEFLSPQEASEAYVNSGANAFDTSMDEFRSEVLMSVANRLDGLLNVIDRAR